VAPVKAVLNRMGVKPSEVMKYLSRPATRDETGIPPDLRKEVQAAFAEDIARLEGLLGQDLSDWKA
jgi:antitoxin component of RelBE/YafQ-DinJ toxin-antitoxin module